MVWIEEEREMSDTDKGREIIARLAEKEGETVFAQEVRAGCWDHRNDVASAIRNPQGFVARKDYRP
jgi:hypothetical protein